MKITYSNIIKEKNQSVHY